MVESLLPAASVAALDSFLTNIDTSSPTKTMYDISRRMRRFDYGCDENVRIGIYRRFPHEMQRYATCEDLGTFMYFAALRAGLDVGFGVMHNFRGTGQKHPEVILRSSSRDLSFAQNRITPYDDVASLADYVQLIDAPEVAQTIREERSDPKVFFNTGQSFSQMSYFAENGGLKDCAIPVQLSRAFLKDDGGFFLRKTYHAPGIYFCVERRTNDIRQYVAKGCDNMLLKEPTLIAHFAKRPNSTKFDTAYGIMTMDLRQRLFRRIYTMDYVCSSIKSARSKKEVSSVLARQHFEQTPDDRVLIAHMLHYFSDKVDRMTTDSHFTIPRRLRRRFANNVVDFASSVISGSFVQTEQNFVYNEGQTELIKKAETDLGIAKDF